MHSAEARQFHRLRWGQFVVVGVWGVLPVVNRQNWINELGSPPTAAAGYLADPNHIGLARQNVDLDGRVRGREQGCREGQDG